MFRNSLFIFTMMLMGVSASVFAQTSQNDASFVPNRVLVKFVDPYDTSLGVYASIYGAQLEEPIFKDMDRHRNVGIHHRQTPLQLDVTINNWYVVSLREGADVLQAAHDIAALPNVEFAHPDYIMSAIADSRDNYERFDQYGMWEMQQIQARDGWDNNESGSIIKGEGVHVAVVDTGIDFNHPDIQTNLWVNPSMVQDNNNDGVIDFKDVDVDYSGKIEEDEYNDGVFGLNVVDFSQISEIDGNDSFNEASYGIRDFHGHGSHVSGTIAAAENDIGIVGVAPKAKIITFKGFSREGKAQLSDLAQGIRYAMAFGADVINNSWGSEGYAPETPLVVEVIKEAYANNVILVFAAGNSARNLDVTRAIPNDMEEVLTVGASDVKNRIANFSNYGNTIDVMAPGVFVLSLSANQHDNTLVDFFKKWLSEEYPEILEDLIVDEGYLHLDGTSMAAPYVSGLAALMRQRRPDWSNQDIMSAIRVSADSIDQYNEADFAGALGSGRINVLNALNQEKTLDIRLIGNNFFKKDGRPIGALTSAIEPGDRLFFEIKLKNFWSETGSIHVDVRPGVDYVEVIHGYHDFGIFQSGEIKTNDTHRFEVLVNDDKSLFGKVGFLMIDVTDTDAQSTQSFRLPFRLKRTIEIAKVDDKPYQQGDVIVDEQYDQLPYYTKVTGNKLQHNISITLKDVNGNTVPFYITDHRWFLVKLNWDIRQNHVGIDGKALYTLEFYDHDFDVTETVKYQIDVLAQPKITSINGIPNIENFHDSVDPNQPFEVTLGGENLHRVTLKEAAFDMEIITQQEDLIRLTIWPRQPLTRNIKDTHTHKLAIVDQFDYIFDEVAVTLDYAEHLPWISRINEHVVVLNCYFEDSSACGHTPLNIQSEGEGVDDVTVTLDGININNERMRIVNAHNEMVQVVTSNHASLQIKEFDQNDVALGVPLANDNMMEMHWTIDAERDGSRVDHAGNVYTPYWIVALGDANNDYKAAVPIRVYERDAIRVHRLQSEDINVCFQCNKPIMRTLDYDFNKQAETSSDVYVMTLEGEKLQDLQIELLNNNQPLAHTVNVINENLVHVVVSTDLFNESAVGFMPRLLMKLTDTSSNTQGIFLNFKVRSIPRIESVNGQMLFNTQPKQVDIDLSPSNKVQVTLTGKNLNYADVVVRKNGIDVVHDVQRDDRNNHVFVSWAVTPMVDKDRNVQYILEFHDHQGYTSNRIIFNINLQDVPKPGKIIFPKDNISITSSSLIVEFDPGDAEEMYFRATAGRRGVTPWTKVGSSYILNELDTWAGKRIRLRLASKMPDGWVYDYATIEILNSSEK